MVTFGRGTREGKYSACLEHDEDVSDDMHSAILCIDETVGWVFTGSPRWKPNTARESQKPVLTGRGGGLFVSVGHLLSLSTLTGRRTTHSTSLLLVSDPVIVPCIIVEINDRVGGFILHDAWDLRCITHGTYSNLVHLDPIPFTLAGKSCAYPKPRIQYQFLTPTTFILAVGVRKRAYTKGWP